MPCYTQTAITIREEQFKARPEIVARALTPFIKEIEAYYGQDGIATVLLTDTALTVAIGSYELTLDMKAGRLTYEQPMASIKNKLKRHYSTSVVQHVSQQLRIRSKFNLKQTGQNEFRLERRR